MRDWYRYEGFDRDPVSQFLTVRFPLDPFAVSTAA